MEALIIGLALKGLAQADGDLRAVGERGNHVFAALAVFFGQGQNGRKYDNGGVLGAVAVVGVHVEGMSEGAVNHGGHLRSGLVAAADCCGDRIAVSQLAGRFQAGQAGIDMAGGDNIAQQIHDKHFGVFHHAVRQVLKLQTGTNFCDLLRKRQFCVHCFVPLFTFRFSAAAPCL